MSAFAVCNGTIDVLVNGAAQYGVTRDAGALRALGQQLWDENYLSVNYRYDEDNEAPAYELHTTEAPLRPYAVINAASCLGYQSCEHPGWHDSAAKASLDAIVAAAEATLTAEENRMTPCRYSRNRTERAYRQTAAYDAEPWEFASLELATGALAHA